MILGKDSRSAATRAIIHQLNQAEGREHNLQNRPQNHSTKCGLNIGAGEGNRTLDIQLGKLTEALDPASFFPRMSHGCRNLPDTERAASVTERPNFSSTTASRVFARKHGTRVRLYSRSGNNLTYRSPLIVEALARLRSPLCDRLSVW